MCALSLLFGLQRFACQEVMLTRSIATASQGLPKSMRIAEYHAISDRNSHMTSLVMTWLEVSCRSVSVAPLTLSPRFTPGFA
jgi:hypothetical protein